MPIHGEYRHLEAHKRLARFMGMKEKDIFIANIGEVLEIDQRNARINGSVPSGKVLVDGYGVGDVGNIVLRDRRHLSQDGLIVVVATVDMDERMLLSGPDIISRGFVYVRESEELIDEIRELAVDTFYDFFDYSDSCDRNFLKTKIKDEISRLIYQRTKRNPMILPVIMNV